MYQVISYKENAVIENRRFNDEDGAAAYVYELAMRQSYGDPAVTAITKIELIKPKSDEILF